MNLLANDLRPLKLEDIIGQEHLTAENKILYNLIKNNKIYSMILYGKPGIGKTSIANAIVNELNMKFRFLNATINNKKDFDESIEMAKMYNGMILVVDEIHRMNKDKQDILLPYIESGLIILIGLTTSNPYHKINPAIRSRCQIFKLNELSIEDIKKGLNKIMLNLEEIKIDDKCLDYIASYSSGDFRSAINLLDIAYNSTLNHVITLDLLKSIQDRPVFNYDNNEDGHYDTISALQKSIRGSDVDASLHYLARLLEAQDLDIIYRRLSVIAYEDIGLANPSIGMKLDAAINASERLGFPECTIPLGEIVTEMALSPKSNSSYMGINKALEDIKTGYIGKIPDHIKTNSKDYKYPHNYAKSYVKQSYLPDNLKDRKYYIAKNNSYENNLNKIHEEMKK